MFNQVADLKTDTTTLAGKVRALEADTTTLADNVRALTTANTTLTNQVLTLTDSIDVLDAIIDSLNRELETCGESPVNKIIRSGDNHGIRFAQNIVSTTAEISVVLPNNDKAIKTEIVVYDAIGNKVFESEGSKGRTESPLIWDLTNSAGRAVANGTYLVIAEVKGQNGMTYHYSAKLGVKR